MKHIQEVEYCDFQLTIRKNHAFDTIFQVVGNQYSSVENSGYMIIYIYLENQVLKLNFKKFGGHIQLMGKNYTFQSEIMVDIMERLIIEGRGNVIIKRFGQTAMFIETVNFGEIVMITEIDKDKKKILYKKKNVISLEDLERLWLSTSVEERIAVWKLEVEYALAWLAEGLRKQDRIIISTYKRKLEELHQERLSLEI